MSDRVRLMVVDRLVLAKALGLPASTKIVGSFTDPDVIDGPLLLKVEDESFTPLLEGARIPRIRGQFEDVSIPRFVRFA